MTVEGSPRDREVDVVLLAALAEEKDAVLAALGVDNREVILRAGEDVHVASVGTLRMAVASLHGMGNVGASATAREVIEVWQPRFLVLVGIAAGIRGYAKDLRLGDVLVADQVVGFELAKITGEGLQRRYQSFPPHFDLLAAARGIAATEWTSMIATVRPDRPGVPRVHVGTVLSGEKVFADIASVQELGRVWPTAVGVEMEGLGVATAAHRGGVGFLLVKGVSDFADASKDDRWRGYAAEAAARFVLAVLRRQPAIPARRSWPRPRQLPRDATGFTGRAAELRRLLQMAPEKPSDWAGVAVVISAIDGMAGVGKTALAVHAGHLLAGRFPDGQLFLDLHGFTAGGTPVQPHEALDRLLRDIGVPGERIPDGVDERAALWRSLLAGRRMLIVLDNAASETQVQPLLPGAAGSLVLVTSRRRLPALEASHTVSLETLPQMDAVRLFVLTADRSELTTDTPESEAQLVEVVQLCGRLPLAIRIAAARLKHRRQWTVTDLAQRLRRLEARLGALDDGQRSVHAALHLSYQHLSADTRRLYRLLGLHPGPEIEPYAAAALMDSSPDQVQRWLDDLVDDHLLAEPVPGRYRFHDLVRAHAAATVVRVETEAQQRSALARLLDHYRRTAAAAMDLAYPYEWQRRPTFALVDTPIAVLADRTQADRWLNNELANLLAAVDYAAKHGWPHHTWHLSVLLDRHLRTRGRYRDAQTLHQQAVDLAGRLGNRTAEMHARIGLGYVHGRLGDYEQSADNYGRALQIAQAIGDQSSEVNALIGLGDVRRMLGDFQQSNHHLEWALRIAQVIGYSGGEIDALTALGHSHRMLGRHEQASNYYGRALRIAQVNGYRGEEQQALTGLGYVHRMLGRYEQASDHLGQALQIAQAIGDQSGESRALTGLGFVHLMLGRYGPAGDHFRQALQIAQIIGDRASGLQALIGLGHVHRMLGRLGDAIDCYQQVLVGARELHGSNWQYEALQGVGRVHHADGQPDLALVCHEQALRYATDLTQPTDQARAHDGLARAHHAKGQHERARHHWQHALNILTDLGIDHAGDTETSVIQIRTCLTEMTTLD